jgi:hypothetical protein
MTEPRIWKLWGDGVDWYVGGRADVPAHERVEVRENIITKEMVERHTKVLADADERAGPLPFAIGYWRTVSEAALRAALEIPEESKT